jgi:hypothetical protein
VGRSSDEKIGSLVCRIPGLSNLYEMTPDPGDSTEIDEGIP